MTGPRRVLVANRGEIAVRVIRACHQIGAEAVAVYSTADQHSRWVHAADASVHIGPSSAAKSYLNRDAMVEAARASGADAVHPGYGFLSERADFARAVTDSGLAFVGPPAAVIEKMGDKAAARRTAHAAGVPIVPGSEPVSDLESALAEAERIEYPVLLKAAAGGGGRGIRPVSQSRELAEMFPAAQGEAKSAFGDDTLYLERALSHPRHIETQVLADTHGTVVHAFERDCSVQRRRQKVLEEAPATSLSEDLRNDINAAAVRLAAHVGYEGAGTVEFLVEDNGAFHFMEMNTRIQVEHPVTEAITGLDLVVEQLRIASGAPLSVNQSDIHRQGAAIELRINAEDPDNQFQPRPGELTTFEFPRGRNVRVDTGFARHDRISPFYDSMIAKLICWGPDRDAAFDHAQSALHEFHVAGVPSTVSLHERLVKHPTLRAGPVHTMWLEQLEHSS